MRYTVFLLLAILLTACGGDDKDSTPVVPSVSVNGFWQDEATANDKLTLLIINDQVYGKDEVQAYRGNVSFDAQTNDVKMELSALPLVANGTASQTTTDSSQEALAYQFEGLYFTGQAYIQGNLDDGLLSGLKLDSDGTWQSGSSLQKLAGVWQADDFTLTINQAGRFWINRLGLQGNEAQANNLGCNANGQIQLLNSQNALYAVTLNKRVNCSAFNGKADGFAAINPDGALDFYLHNEVDQLFMSFELTELEVKPEEPEQPNPDEGEEPDEPQQPGDGESTGIN